MIQRTMVSMGFDALHHKMEQQHSVYESEHARKSARLEKIENCHKRMMAKLSELEEIVTEVRAGC